MKTYIHLSLNLTAFLFFFGCSGKQQKGNAADCYTRISLPSGYENSIVADSPGDFRHIIVNSIGDIRGYRELFAEKFAEDSFKNPGGAKYRPFRPAENANGAM